MIRRAAVVGAFLATFMVLPLRAGATPILSAPSVTQNIGDTFTIPIDVAGASSGGVTSFQFDLTFDPSIIQLQAFSDVDSTMGGLDGGTDFQAADTAGGGVLTGLTGFPLGSPVNTLSGVADSMNLVATGLTPGGSLLLVEFHALAAGVSPLTLSNAFLTDNGVDLSSASGDFSLQNGQVCVLPSSCILTPPTGVPEPTTLLLVGSGLALAVRRRKTSRRLTP